MSSYDSLRQTYRPSSIEVLFIAESPPPAANVQSSRQFYMTDRIRKDDRLFVNTMRALYPAETVDSSEKMLEETKETWLRRFQHDGYYMIEALEVSLEHEVTKDERQALIREHLPKLLRRVRQLTTAHTKIILIKSNVFEVAAQPLRDAGYTVLNQELVDYPGRFNQRAYREKVAALLQK